MSLRPSPLTPNPFPPNTSDLRPATCVAKYRGNPRQFAPPVREYEDFARGLFNLRDRVRITTGCLALRSKVFVGDVIAFERGEKLPDHGQLDQLLNHLDVTPEAREGWHTERDALKYPVRHSRVPDPTTQPDWTIGRAIRTYREARGLAIDAIAINVALHQLRESGIKLFSPGDLKAIRKTLAIPFDVYDRLTARLAEEEKRESARRRQSEAAMTHPNLVTKANLPEILRQTENKAKDENPSPNTHDLRPNTLPPETFPPNTCDLTPVTFLPYRALETGREMDAFCASYMRSNFATDRAQLERDIRAGHLDLHVDLWTRMKVPPEVDESAIDEIAKIIEVQDYVRSLPDEFSEDGL